jgi:AraC-like DNA-binding protein
LVSVSRHNVESPWDHRAVKRLPRPALRPFVETLWAMDETALAQASCRREHVIPTGRMHLVFRLSDYPLRLFEHDGDREGRIVSTMVVGGARAGYYVRDVSTSLCSVGALLRPGAAEVLFGVHAHELSDSHTALEDLWGADATSMRDQLGETRSLEGRIDTFERLLAERLPIVRGLHPAVARALEQLRSPTAVHEIVKQSGYSHRRFITLFSRAVGLTPKTYARVMRFQQALRHAAAPGGRASWIDVANTAGYSDQSHFNREFREFTGVTPGEYRLTSPRSPHHVPVGLP